MKYRILLCMLVLLSACAPQAVPPRAQNPSPMEEHIRPHVRVKADSSSGQRIGWELDDKKVQLFIPETLLHRNQTELLIHFHGLPEVCEYAIEGRDSIVLATVWGGSGGGSYERVFQENDQIRELIKRCEAESGLIFSKITLSGWSAGYGAIRAIIRKHPELINRVILLDGIHTGYLPDRQVLYEGGKLDSALLTPFGEFAQLAMAGEKEFLVTHTSIFPGTFASTTECTDYLLRISGLERKPELKAWPLGLQQVGSAGSGRFRVLSFAGNTAPDHVDHLHALRWFLYL